jgi:hypothetical protein
MYLRENVPFEYIDANMDVNNFIHYYIAEIYYANKDWPGNNIKYWQPKKLGGKWRWILFDTDLGFALPTYFTATHKTLDFVTDSITNVSWPNPQWSTILFRCLIKNQVFKDKFIQTFQASLNSVFKPQRVTGIIDSISSLYAAEMVYHKAKWGGNISLWNRHVDSLKLFASERNGFMTNHLRDFFKLTQPLQDIEVSVYPENAGSVILNGIKFPSKDSFQVFQSLTYTLNVKAASGYKFKQWRIKRGNDSEYTSNNITFNDTTNSKISYTAEFEVKSQLKDIYINEIAANNDSIKDNYGNSDDWFELYNGNSDTIDITGLFLTDNFKQKNKFQIRSNGFNNLKIPPYGYSVFWADDEQHQGNNHTSFKLSATGERIGFYQVVGTDTLLIDTITYGAQIKSRSYIRFPDGANDWFFTTTLTPQSSNIKSIIDAVVSLQDDGSKLTIYPNPVKNSITIGQATGLDNATFYVCNSLGQKVLSGRIKNLQINCNTLRQGIYYLVIIDQSKKFNCSFIKE